MLWSTKWPCLIISPLAFYPASCLFVLLSFGTPAKKSIVYRSIDFFLAAILSRGYPPYIYCTDVDLFSLYYLNINACATINVPFVYTCENIYFEQIAEERLMFVILDLFNYINNNNNLFINRHLSFTYGTIF